MSVPKAYVDTTNYKYPIGPAQTKEFQKLGKLSENVNPYGLEGNTNYREDNRALKLIAQDQWEVTNSLELTFSTHTTVLRSRRKSARSMTSKTRTRSWARRATTTCRRRG